ncbi:RNA-directed DNA polymerase, eukaryota [Tanacetum coccineum]
MLWQYLAHIIGGWNGDVIIMGDFNEVRFDSFVFESWKDIQIQDQNAMLNFAKKLKILKGRIHSWVKDEKEKAHVLKNSLKKKLADIDSIVDKGEVTSDVLEVRLDTMNSLTKLENMESIELAQKAKIKWSIEGDENSKNRIDSLCNDRLTLDMVFPNVLSHDQAQDLERAFSKDEIKQAVWDCGLDKSPGPDGFTFGFYRKFWSLLEDDVVDAVCFFYSNGFCLKGINSSFIALIPKSQGANLVKDFRPISLIGSIYKIIAKLLANRLVTVLDGLVNEVQSAFIANRQILDGPFILNELIHLCKAKKKQSLIFKVDFEKAFDSVRWDFLDDILKKFGFGPRWRDWIQSCLKSSRGSILVNGSPTSEFQFYKGLKQGDPLSPLLFILVMESLHLSFHNVVNASLFKGVGLDNSLQLSHLFYVDDVVFIGNGVTRI